MIDLDLILELGSSTIEVKGLIGLRVSNSIVASLPIVLDVPLLGTGAVVAPNLDACPGGGAATRDVHSASGREFRDESIGTDFDDRGGNEAPFLGVGVVGVPDLNIGTICITAASDVNGTTEITGGQEGVVPFTIEDKLPLLSTGLVGIPELDVSGGFQTSMARPERG